jgi:hypothetical protein
MNVSITNHPVFSKDLAYRLLWSAIRPFGPAGQLGRDKTAGKPDQEDNGDQDDLGHGDLPEIQSKCHLVRVLKKKDQEQDHKHNGQGDFEILHFRHLRSFWIDYPQSVGDPPDSVGCPLACSILFFNPVHPTKTNMSFFEVGSGSIG